MCHVAQRRRWGADPRNTPSLSHLDFGRGISHLCRTNLMVVGTSSVLVASERDVTMRLHRRHRSTAHAERRARTLLNTQTPARNSVSGIPPSNSASRSEVANVCSHRRALYARPASAADVHQTHYTNAAHRRRPHYGSPKERVGRATATYFETSGFWVVTRNTVPKNSNDISVWNTSYTCHRKRHPESRPKRRLSFQQCDGARRSPHSQLSPSRLPRTLVSDTLRSTGLAAASTATRRRGVRTRARGRRTK